MDPSVQANFFAYVALFSWPFVAIGFFLMMPPRWAGAVSLVAGDMFLPPKFGVHIAGLPLLDKDLIVSISAVLGCLIVRPRAILGGSKTGSRYFIFILILMVGAFFTVQTNQNPIPIAHRVLPALTFHDFISTITHDLLYWWPAFFLGRKLFTKAEDLEVLCTVMTMGGLIYSLFIFVELRMSPLFNNWVYGYRAGSFDQTIRAGGYRPTVFMRHGLNVALFMLMSVLAATGLARARVRVWGISARWIAIYLALVLVACHSVGALVNAIVLVPALIWMRPRMQSRVATLIAGLVLFYPLLRFYDLIPVDSMINFFTATFGAERAESLNFRLVNEGELLKRATERPWFGWGGWNRQFLFTSWGAMATIVDGEWIAVLGGSGAVGFLGVFGLMLVPIFVFARRLRKMVSQRDAILGSAVLFISVAYVFDLLPNSGVAPYLMMMIGALAGITIDDGSEAQAEVGYYVAAS